VFNNKDCPENPFHSRDRKLEIVKEKNNFKPGV
jgi:hypothetical protein